MGITSERISFLAVNFQSALAEKNLLQLEQKFPNTCFIAKALNLAESLRTDIDDEVEIKIEVTKILCQKFGFFGFENSILLKLEKLGILRIGKTNIEVLCKCQKELLQLMGTKWLRMVHNHTSEVMETTLMEFLEKSSLNPLSELEVKEILKHLKSEESEALLIILKNLNLIIYLEEVKLYCSPETFGTTSKKNILEKLSEFKSGENLKLIIGAVQKIKDNPALPLDFVKNQEIIKELSRVGIIEPFGINVGGRSIKFLFDPSLQSDDLYLSKETAAHFSYANKFATRQHGRLNDPTLFLSRLIDRGHAGLATNIGTDYNSLILNRVIRTEKGGLTGKYTMYVVKQDILENGENILGGLKPFKPKFLETKLTDFTKNPPETRLDPEMKAILSKDLVKNFQEILRQLKE